MAESDFGGEVWFAVSSGEEWEEVRRRGGYTTVGEDMRYGC